MTTAGWTELARGLYLEGLAVDHVREVVWYSDVIGGGVHGVRFDGTPVGTLNEGRMWTGGVMMNADGAVLSTGQYGVMWNNPDTGQSGWLIDEVDGQPLDGVNEMAPDGEGGVFFGTIDMDSVIAGQTARPARLYRLTRERKLIRLCDDFGFANGMAFDADRRRLYCNATFDGTWMFDVEADLTLSGKRRFLDKEDADGMALDAAGNLWITGFRSDFLDRRSPSGEALGHITAPPGAITQARFGGADGRDLFITLVPADSGDTLKEGGAISAANSRLCHMRADVPGRLLAPAQFDLS